MSETENTCFYCNDVINEQNIHYISFFHNSKEREETLCDVCYSEWLEGMKG